MIEHCPPVRAKIRPATSRKAGNTLALKEFPGGFLKLAHVAIKLKMPKPSPDESKLEVAGKRTGGTLLRQLRVGLSRFWLDQSMARLTREPLLESLDNLDTRNIAEFCLTKPSHFPHIPDCFRHR